MQKEEDSQQDHRESRVVSMVSQPVLMHTKTEEKAEEPAVKPDLSVYQQHLKVKADLEEKARI
jgi:hypothetical protein